MRPKGTDVHPTWRELWNRTQHLSLAAAGAQLHDHLSHLEKGMHDQLLKPGQLVQ